MKRGGELKRRKPLRTRSTLKSGKGLARTRMKKKPPPPGFTEETKAKVRRRSGNRCEVQGAVCTGAAEHFHHRKSRRFGDHSTQNCLHLCRACHDYAHANPVMARLLGWIVHSTLEPGKVPVKLGSQA